MMQAGIYDSEQTDSEGVAPGRGLFALCSHWAIPFNKDTPPPMDDFSVSVTGGIDMLGYLHIIL